MFTASALAAQGSFPWQPGSAPPTVAGIDLGDDRDKVLSVLGEPTSIQTLGDGVEALGYEALGLVVTWARLDGVAVIDLRTRDAGDIGGVRVGDRVESVIGRWGPPHQGGEGVGLYLVDEWAIVVRTDEVAERVSALSLGRVAG